MVFRLKRHISNALKYHWAHAMEVAKEDRRVDEMDSCWLFPGNPVAVNKLWFALDYLGNSFIT